MSGVEGRAAAVALPFHPDRTYHRRYARSTGTKFKLVGNRFRLWTNELVDCYRAGNEALVRRGYGTCFVFQISRRWSGCGRPTDLLRSKVNCWALRRLSPTSSTEYQGMVDFHWSAANLPRPRDWHRRAEGCRTTSGTRSVTDHEPGRWRGIGLDQRRATHEALTGVCLVLAAPTRLLLRCMSSKLARLWRRAHHRWICPFMGVKRSCRLRAHPSRRLPGVLS